MREKVRVGWPCYQLGWVGQAGRRLLSTGRDRQMLALLPGQNISPGAGSTQSGPGSCNPNDHWWRCTWPTDQLNAPSLSLPGPSLLFDLQRLQTLCRKLVWRRDLYQNDGENKRGRGSSERDIGCKCQAEKVFNQGKLCGCKGKKNKVIHTIIRKWGIRSYAGQRNGGLWGRGCNELPILLPRI